MGSEYNLRAKINDPEVECDYVFFAQFNLCHTVAY